MLFETHDQICPDFEGDPEGEAMKIKPVNFFDYQYKYGVSTKKSTLETLEFLENLECWLFIEGKTVALNRVRAEIARVKGI